MAVYAVIGVPRSGTSLLAGILHALGVPMGRQWVPLPDGWQPDGSYADAEICALHQRMIQAADVLEYGMQLDRRSFREYAALIASRNADHPGGWGLKCPCLPFVWPHFVAVTGEVRLLRVKRPLAQALASYQARTGMPDAQAVIDMRLWQAATDAVWANYAGPKVAIPFDGLVDDPPAVVDQIALFAGLSVVPEAISLVKPEWRRF